MSLSLLEWINRCIGKRGPRFNARRGYFSAGMVGDWDLGAHCGGGALAHENFDQMVFDPCDRGLLPLAFLALIKRMN